MSHFPPLRTGAVVQYPAERATLYSNFVARFVDGSEQRSRASHGSVHRWTISLAQLDEGELAALDGFFVLEGASAGTFSFTDPWDGVLYPTCSIQQDELKQTWKSLGDGRTQLVILENRS